MMKNLVVDAVALVLEPSGCRVTQQHEESGWAVGCACSEQGGEAGGAAVVSVPRSLIPQYGCRELSLRIKGSVVSAAV